MRFSKLLKFLLAGVLPLYADDEEGGGGEPVDWGALNDGVSPGSDDGGEEEGGGAPSATPAPSPAATPTPTPAPSGGKDGSQKTTTPTPTPSPSPAPGQDGEEEDDSNLTEEEKAAKADAAAKKNKPPAPQPKLTPEQEEEQRRNFEEWEKGEITRLAGEYESAISEDDAALLQTEPEKVLPRFAAKIRMDTMKATLHAVGQLMPQILQTHGQAADLEAQAQNAFFSVNEDLRDVPVQKIVQAGQAFRSLNPDVTDPNEVIEGVGNMVRVMMKKAAKEGTGGKAPASNGSKKGYSPAGAGGQSKAPPPAKDEGNPWSDLADD